MAEEKLAQPLGQGRIPLLIAANRITQRDNLWSLAMISMGVGDEELAGLCSSGQVLWLIDGLNEVPSRHFLSTLSEIRNLMARFAGCAYVASSRFARIIRQLGFLHLSLGLFDDGQVREFIHRAFPSDEKAESFLSQLSEAPRLLSLCRNPLLLFMLTDICKETFQVPRNSGQLLHQFMRRFLERERYAFGPTDPLTMELVLSDLAFHMRVEGGVSIPNVKAQHLIESRLDKLDKSSGVVDVLGALTRAQVLRESGTDRLIFFHELIQEYYAALELCSLYTEDPSILTRHLNDVWWKEIVVLFFGMTEERSSAFKTISEHDIALSARCVMDASLPDSTLQSAVVARATKALDAGEPQPEVFEALGTIWNEGAREAVIESLTKKHAAEDFFSFFTERPQSAAVDLLCSHPSPAVLAGALKTFSKDPAALDHSDQLRLGSVFLDLAGRWLSGEMLDLGPMQLSLLLPSSKLEERLRPDALAIGHRLLLAKEVETTYRMANCFGLFGKDAIFDESVAIGLAETGSGERVPALLQQCDLPDASKLDLSARLFLRGNFLPAAIIARTLPNWDWVAPLLGPSAEMLLRNGTSSALIKSFLEPFLPSVGIAQILTISLNRFSVPVKELAAILDIIGNPHFSIQAPLDYLTYLLAENAKAEQIKTTLSCVKPGTISVSVAQLLLEAADRGGYLPMAIKAVIANGLADNFGEQINDVKSKALRGDVDLHDRDWAEIVFKDLWETFIPSAQLLLLNSTMAQDMSAVPFEAWRTSAFDHLVAEVKDCIQSNAHFDLFKIPLSLSKKPMLRPLLLTMLNGMIELRVLRTATELIIAWQVEPSELTALATDSDLRREMRGQIAGLASVGKVKAALHLIDLMKYPLSEDEFMGLDFSDGTASGQLVRHAIRDGSISEPHLVKWFAKHLASGDVEEALKIFHPSVRQLLLEPALLGAIGLIESENYVQAARIIVAFDLREDFSGDIRRLISNCLEAGKSGVAANLAETLGPSFTVEFHQIVEATVSALLEKQQFNAVAGLLGERRLAFSRHRLVEVLTLRFNSLVKQKRYSDISAFLNSTLCPYLPAGSVASAIGSGPVPISATVSYKRADRYFLLLTFRKDLPNIMLHGSISPRLFPELEVGDRCLVRVEPTERGYRAVFAERSLL